MQILPAYEANIRVLSVASRFRDAADIVASRKVTLLPPRAGDNNCVNKLSYKKKRVTV